MELYSRYSSYIKEVNFRMNHNKKHLVTICVKDIQEVDKQIINLIIDFLKFIKRKNFFTDSYSGRKFRVSKRNFI